MAKVRILFRQETPAQEPARAGQADITTVYTLLDVPGHVDRIRLPKDGWSEAKEEAAIRARVAPSVRGVPREFDVT